MLDECRAYSIDIQVLKSWNVLYAAIQDSCTQLEKNKASISSLLSPTGTHCSRKVTNKWDRI